MFAKRIGVILLLLPVTLCLPSGEVEAQFNVRLSPILQELEVGPGARKTFNLFVDNDGVFDTVTIRAYTGDMTQEQIGAYAILQEGESEFSCADWITLSDTLFALPPGSAKAVTASLKAPRDAFGGRYAAVIFEILPQKREAERVFGRADYRFQMPCFVEVTIKRFGGVVKKLEIIDFKAEPVTNPRMMQKVGKNAMIFQATAKNEGNMHVKAKGTLFIRTKEGRTKRRVPLGAGRGIVLPGASLNFRSIVKKPPPGDYVAQAMIRYGRPSPALAEAAFSVGARIKGSESFAASSFLALEVQPEEVVQQVPAGGFRYVNLRFRSQEVESVYVSSKVMDLEYDEEGNLAVVEPAPDHRFCGDWLEVNPTSFALRPGQTKNVALKVSVPRQLAGGYYSCLVFDATTKGVQTAPLAAPFQIPVLLNLPIGAELNGEISEINVSASPDNPAEVEVLFKNTGNTHVKPRGKLVLKVWPQAAVPAGVEYAGEEEYQPVGEVPLESIEEYVLPGEIRRVGISYPERLPPGKYLAEITIDYGGDSPAESQKEFRIK